MSHLLFSLGLFFLVSIAFLLIIHKLPQIQLSPVFTSPTRLSTKSQIVNFLNSLVKKEDNSKKKLKTILSRDKNKTFLGYGGSCSFMEYGVLFCVVFFADVTKTENWKFGVAVARSNKMRPIPI